MYSIFKCMYTNVGWLLINCIHLVDLCIKYLQTALASGSEHSQRRTRSESDIKRVPPPEAKRVKLDKHARRRSSSIDEEPPNSREPPEVYRGARTQTHTHTHAHSYAFTHCHPCTVRSSPSQYTLESHLFFIFLRPKLCSRE